MITIRPFEERDAEACSKINIENFLAANQDGEETTRKLVEKNTPEALIEKSKVRSFFVAEDDGEVVGIAGYLKNEFKTLFVKRSCQGRGIGKHLTEHVLRLLEEQGHEIIFLQASVEGEPFYKQFGFKTTERKKIDFYGSPRTYIRMERRT